MSKKVFDIGKERTSIWWIKVKRCTKLIIKKALYRLTEDNDKLLKGNGNRKNKTTKVLIKTTN